jgi:hypothetical protein
VIDFIDNEDEENLIWSVFTLGETRKGVAKIELGEKRTRLQSWLDGDLVVRFGTRLLPVGAVVASTRVRCRARPRGVASPYRLWSV